MIDENFSKKTTVKQSFKKIPYSTHLFQPYLVNTTIQGSAADLVKVGLELFYV